MKFEFTFTIAEIDQNGVIWLQLNHNGSPVFKEPLAAALRRFIDNSPEAKMDESRADGWNTEKALLKVKISTAMDHELGRA